MRGTFRINGISKEAGFRGEEVLLDLLRGLGHTEVKEGCREGACGTCLVLLDGALVNSCQVLAASALEKEVTTVSGLGTIARPHPIQEAFAESGAVQCGFCTPGMVLAAFALLKDRPRPTEPEIRQGLDGNLCRCTGYLKIIDAVKLAAERMARHG